MQRLALQSSHILLRSVRSSLPNSQFCPSLRALNTSFRLSSTPITPKKQVPDTPPPSFAGYFKLERQVFVASLPLIPLAYFVHGPVIDAILTVAIVANCHFGAHAVLTDYARPIVVGEKAAKLAHYAAYLSTLLILAGLLHFNYNDVGLTRAFELVFSL